VTLLSVVIPVYKVQGYLRQCLDSIFDQSFTDVEVIAVDDNSPDGSGRILADYAAREPRLRVVTLPENMGQGPARNIGLEHAVGRYVWFVDSDDWLAPGALAAVADRLDQTDADVLVVDWVRSHWNGRVQPSTAVTILPTAPDVFDLRSWPKLVNVLHLVSNKIVRRELLTRLGFRFEAGWYEDLTFTYTVLPAAERISVLNRVCFHYRQRRVGAATRTAGDGHFAIFTHWARVFELINRLAHEATVLRRALFLRMMWHLLIVLGNGHRIHGPSRRAFFRRIHEHYLTFLPAGGYQRPAGVEGVKHRLVARGWYRIFEVLRAANLMRARLRRAGRRTVTWWRRRAGVARRWVYRAYYRMLLRLPADETLAVYSAYWHRGYACNPAAIYEKARELSPGVRGVWAVDRTRASDMPAGVDFVVAGTVPYYRTLARAKYLINNVNWPDWAEKRPDAVHVMTHHGTPLKAMGLDQLAHPAAMKETDIAALMRRVDRWDFSITANAFTTEQWERAYPSRYETLQVGYPRNDRLVRTTPDAVAGIRQRLEIPPDKTVVLYAPTHREWQPDGQLVLDVEDLARRFGPDHVVLVRAHYFNVKPGLAAVNAAGRVVDVSGYPVVEDLYLASDVLITDYSSVMFDFAVLDRPIVVFAPDWQAYQLLRGVYFDLMAEPPGAVATTYPELLDIFRTGAYADEDAATARRHFRARFCDFEDGNAAERVVRRVLPTSAAVTGGERPDSQPGPAFRPPRQRAAAAEAIDGTVSTGPDI
jgi:CDP-glycerol glycerophosphotransferase